MSNPILNGRMRVCQNPTSVSNAPDGTEVCDKWVYNKIGAVAHTVSQDSFVPTIAQQKAAGHPRPRLLKNSYRLTLTTPDNALAASDEVVIVQKIDGARFAEIAQTPQKIGFMVHNTLPATFSVSFRNNVPDISCVLPVTIDAGDTWEWKVLDLPPSPAGGTWSYDSSACGVRAGLVLAAGSTFHAPFSGNWIPGYFHAMAGQTNMLASGNTDFRFTDFQFLDPDGQPFEAPPSYEEELAACRRIRRRYTGLPNNGMMLAGVALSSTTAQFVIHGMKPLTNAAYGGTPKLRDEGVAAPAVTSMSVVAAVDGTSNLYVTVTGGLVTGHMVTLCASGPSDYVDLASVI